MRKTIAVFAFFLLLLSIPVYSDNGGTEKAPKTENGIGVFDGVYEIVHEALNAPLLPPDEYDVAYDPIQKIYTIQIDSQRLKRDYALLQRKVTGLLTFSGKITFPTPSSGDGLVVIPGIMNFSKSAFFRSYYYTELQQKRTTVNFHNAPQQVCSTSNLRSFSSNSVETFYFRIHHYPDLQQTVCEWSEDGREWFGNCYPVSFEEEEYEAYISFISKVPIGFRLENLKLKPVDFAYGQRTVEKIDERSAKVTIEITHPESQQEPIDIQERIEGNVSVVHISHRGTLEKETGVIDVHRLQWRIPDAKGKTHLQYVIETSQPTSSNLALFQGRVKDELIVGAGEYTLAPAKEIPEDIQHWRIWSAIDGLPDSPVRFLNVGSSGSVYITNFDPSTKSLLLNRFDGYQFHPISVTDELEDGFIREGLDGSLWFYQKWNLYRQKKDEKDFYTWELCKNRGDQPLQVTNQQTLAFLHCFDDTVGVNTAKYRFMPIDAERIYCLLSDRLILYNANTREEKVILKAEETALDTFVHMLLSKNMKLWITGDKGVIQVDLKNSPPTIVATYTVHANSPLCDFELPIEGIQGNLLLRATHKRFALLDYIVILDQKLKPLSLGHGAPVALSEDNRLWMLGMDESDREYIALCNPSEKRILTRGREPLTMVTGDFANEDNGSFWLGSNLGLVHYSPPLWRKPEGLHDIQNEISTITEDSAGNLWALDQGHLIKYNGREWTRYPKPRTISFWRYNSQSIALLSNGRLAINVGGNASSHSSRPFCIFDPITETFEFVYHPEKIHCFYSAPGQCHDMIVTVYNKKTNEIQLDTYENNQFLNLIKPEEETGTKISFLNERENGDILIGGNGKEPLRWYRNGEKLALPEEQKFPGSIVLSILEVAPDKLWVGDNNTLYEFDGTRWSVIRSNLNKINSMIKARDGSIWVASRTGLHRFKDNQWVTHNTEDGFRYNFIYKIFEDSQGRLWAGTEDGVYLYHPEADPDPPQTYIPEKVNLKDFASKGEVRINFSGLDRWKYTEQDRLMYSYRLNQGEWSAFDTPNVATFANMPPDDYTIEVQAMDRNWNIDPSPASFSFRVNHVPIQERAWFIPLIVGTISLILLLAILAIVSRFQLAEFARNLESMVETRTKELHQTQRNILSISEREQQRIGQDLHDDVVQDLVGIAINSEVLLEELLAESPKRAEELQKILTKMDDATVKTQRLARGLSPVSIDKLGLVGSLQNICTHIRDYYGVDCHYQGEQRIPDLDSAQRLNLYRIAQEATNNAIKHAAANQIVIQLSHTTDRLTLEIRDNGKGFDGGGSILGMGLHIMNYRANTIGAEFDIKSASCQGTSVVCVLPLSKNVREEEHA